MLPGQREISSSGFKSKLDMLSFRLVCVTQLDLHGFSKKLAAEDGEM